MRILALLLVLMAGDVMAQKTTEALGNGTAEALGNGTAKARVNVSSRARYEGTMVSMPQKSTTQRAITTTTERTMETMTLALSTLLGSLNYLTSASASGSKLDNVSSLFISVASGQMHVVLGRVDRKPGEVTVVQKNRMEEVRDGLDDLNRKANGHGKEYGQRKWSMDWMSRLTTPSDVYNGTGEPPLLKAREMDNCFSQMTGTGKYFRACSVSVPCWRTMTRPTRSLPYLSNELRFLSIGENSGCVRMMSELGPTSTSPSTYFRLVQAVCSTLKALLTQEDEGQFDGMHYENMIFGGMYGFKDFFASSASTVRYLASLTNANGCVTDTVQKPSGTGLFMQLMGVQPGVCYVERSAITVAYLVQFLKFFVEDPKYVDG